MTPTPLQLSLVVVFIGAALLATAFLYLWRLDRVQRALLYWGLAFSAHALRTVVQLLGTQADSDWSPPLAYLLFGTLIGILWRGNLAFSALKPHRGPFWLLAATTAWAVLATLLALSPILATLPLYAVSAAVIVHTGLGFWDRRREAPAVGNGIIGVLFVLWGVSLAAQPFLHLAPHPLAEPVNFVASAILLFCIGLTLVLSSQREQWLAAERLSRALLDEAERRKVAEAALEASHRRFRALCDSSTLGIFVTDADGRTEYTSMRLLLLLGLTDEPLHGNDWQSRLHPDDRPQVDAALEKARHRRMGADFECRMRVPGDREIWCAVKLAPITDGGHLRGFVGTVENITRRRMDQEALRVSQAMFSGAIQSSTDCITISYLENGELLEVNEAFERIFGWPYDEAVGRSVSELDLWPDPKGRLRMVEEIRRSGSLRDYPSQLRSRDGQLRDCLFSGALFPLQGKDCLIAIIRDISEQQRARHQLRESEHKLATIFEMAPVPILITRRPDYHIAEVNPLWQQTFGFSEEQARNRTTLELGLWREPEERIALLRELETCGEVAHHEGTLLDRQGQPREFLISARPMSLDDATGWVLWILIDISEPRRMQRELETLNRELEARVERRTAELRNAQEELIRSEKLASLGALVAGLSHELNTPIGNSVTVASTLENDAKGFAGRLQEGNLRRSELEQFVHRTLEAADLMLRGLSRALDLIRGFKQVAADQASEQRRLFDLSLTVRELLLTLKPMLKNRSIQVSVAVPDGLVLDSYPGPLGQVLTNLVANALLHGFDGREGGHIRIEGGGAGDSAVRLSFEDDGKGIAPEHLRQIYDPFFTTRLGTGGSGLGLHICYNLVTGVLGGRIEVDSEVGRGTRFTLTLPRVAPSQTKPAGAALTTG